MNRIDPSISPDDERDGQAFFDAAFSVTTDLQIQSLDYVTAAQLWRVIRAAKEPEAEAGQVIEQPQSKAEILRADARALDTGMDPELVRELHAEADRLDGRPTVDSMADELRRFCQEQELPEYSADDLLMLEGVTPDQRTWLTDFCTRWEAMMERDHAVH